MEEIVILEGARTPHGAFLGNFKDLSAVDLGETALRGLLDRTDIKEEIDYVAMGNSTQAGIGQVPGRQVAYKAGIPEEVPATTVNEASGSSLRALTLVADRIGAGRIECGIAGGMESMSNTPHVVKGIRQGKKFGNVEMIDSMIRDSLWDMNYDKHMGALTEELVEKYDISREEQDRYALQSHERAVNAVKEGLFEEEIVPVKVRDEEIVEDEGPRPDTSMEKLSDLDPVFKENGTVTAGNASDLSDGASAVAVASREFAQENGLKTKAVIEDYQVSYRDPKWFPLAIEDAVKKLIDRNGLEISDVDLFELNEAFAAHMVDFKQKLGIPYDKLNVRGGAVALGHPIGASGGILTTTLVHTMEEKDAKYGIVGMCVGGGGGIAVLLRRD
ncbi:MAG: thiolase family protein [Candidatus Nanohaloarchaea archaeon]|nr:thiolase family protein [Candidatus Nanohaloarchaea archaeon]